MKKAFLIFSISIFGFLSCTLQFGKKTETVKSDEEKRNVKITSELNRMISSGFIIGSGDILKVDVYGEKEISGEYQVSPEGMVTLPLIGDISVLGLNNFQLAKKIENSLLDGFIKNPQVTVLVKDFRSKGVYVLGEVKNAGRYVIKDTLSVVEAVSLAGGFTRIADKKNVILTRKLNGTREKRITINIDSIVKGKRKRFPLIAGDVIYVPERFF